MSDDRPGVGAEPGGQPEDPHETVNRESHPNASGPDGLAGDMGLSSERTGPFGGIEGTGSRRSARDATDGQTPTFRTGETGPLIQHEDDAETPRQPDETAAASGVDRTVGEVRPDPVEHKHEFDPSKNPRH